MVEAEKKKSRDVVGLRVIKLIKVIKVISIGRTIIRVINTIRIIGGYVN